MSGELKASIIVIDESYPGNVLSDPTRRVDLSRREERVTEYVPESHEGFHGDYKKHQALAKFVLGGFSVKQRGPLLEVGPGQNLTILTEAVQSGIPALGLDLREDPIWRKLANSGAMGFDTGRFNHAPKEEAVLGSGIRIYSGDIAQLGYPDSQLINHKFGLVLFNGSFSAGGVNFTFTDNIRSSHTEEEWKKFQRRKKEDEDWGRIRRNSYVSFNPSSARDVIEKKLTVTLSTIRDHLITSGLIGIISSRYAYWGAGYWFEDLPSEKLIFLDLLNRFNDLGATKCYLIGISYGAFKKAVWQSYNDLPDKNSLMAESSISKTLNLLMTMKTEETIRTTRAIFEAEANETRVQTIIDLTGNTPAISRLARIDALFAEF